MNLITAPYILLSVSAGTMEQKGKEDMPWASVEVANITGKSTGVNGNVAYGSPVVKLKLIDLDTGLPNIVLGKKLEAAACFGQIVNFVGTYELVKKAGVEQMSFTIFDAEFNYQPATATPAPTAKAS